MFPKVTVICTCYNHEQYVLETLNSVINQQYSNVELIIIDNNSTDGSAKVIQLFSNLHPHVKYIELKQNIGLCRAFNMGLRQATGEYIIDLAADDILTPDRIIKQVSHFQRLTNETAVVFTNATYIDETGQHIGYHYAIDQHSKSTQPIPEGNVYKEILKKYFICTPTMMMRKSVLIALGGYDESLAYEDFDFFVRSSNKYKYAYLDEILTKKRVLSDSLSTQFYHLQNPLLQSSFEVCNKAYALSRSQEEYDLLADRIREFIKKCFIAENPTLAQKFRKLLRYIQNPGWQTNAIVLVARLRLPVNGVYSIYNKYRNQKSMQLMRQGVPFIKI
jgi:glycosyltransferase involved in cell wall biosynthesis